MNIHQNRASLWLSITSLAVAAVAILISFLTPYYSILKPFDLRIRIDPNIGLHHRNNLGLYLNIDLYNKSPKSGLITDACVVLYGKHSPEDKYLLKFRGFRVLTVDKAEYKDSEEELPLLLEPWQRTNKTITFFYNYEQEFPISMGTYMVELRLWVDDNLKPHAVRLFRFEITKDVLDEYVWRRGEGSTTLIMIPTVGYTPRVSKKLTEDEYRLLQ